MSRTKKIIIALIAVIVGLPVLVAGSAVVLMMMFSYQKQKEIERVMGKPVVTTHAKMDVIRIKHDLPAGTALTKEMVYETESNTTEYVPKDRVTEKYLRHFYGQRLKVTIKKDTILSPRYFR